MNNLRTLREQLREFRRSTLAAPVIGLAVTWAVYGAAFSGALAAESRLVRLALGLLAGVASGSLFMMGHDACHNSLTRVARVNRVLGRIAFLPSYHAYSPWELSHNRIHHIYTNLRGKDFVWLPLSKAEFDALSPLRRLHYRASRNAIGLALYYPVDIWWTRIFFPRGRWVDRPRARYTLDSLLVLGFMVAQVALTTRALERGLAAWAEAVLFAIVVPTAVFSWMIGFVIYFNHTHPDVPWFDKPEEWSPYIGTIRGTARLMFPDWSMVVASNIMDHVAHHADPRIPLVRLREANDRISELYPEVVVQPWSVRALLDTVARCKLYDYENHVWTDYEGNPTSKVHEVPARSAPARAPEDVAAA